MVKRIPLLYSLFCLTPLAQSLEASDLSGPPQAAGLLESKSAAQVVEIGPGSPWIFSRSWQVLHS